MAIQKISADLLQGASVNKKNAEMMRLPAGPGLFLDFPKAIYNRIVAGEIEEVEYDDAVTPLIVPDTQDPTKTVELKFCRISKVVESGLGKLQKAKKFVEAAQGFDMAAFTNAMSIADAITF